jgi:hypothetical protein
MKTTAPKIMTFGAADEADRRVQLAQLLRNSPIPNQELMLNVGLYLTPQTLSRVLFMDFLYRQILDTQGIVVEFGCRWGQNMSLYTSLRGIYEPFNRLRRVVGFDTFSGFVSVADEDGKSVDAGDYATTPRYEDHLAQVLELQEKESPMGHLRKHEIVKGDATKTFADFLARNPQTIVALAYFDFDLFEPTRDCLKLLEPYLTKGSVIGFDELNDDTTPGETVALREVFGLGRFAIRHYRHSARTSYLVVE